MAHKVWTLVPAQISGIGGMLAGFVRDAVAAGCEVVPILTVEMDYVTVLAVHPFAGVVTAGFSFQGGSVAGSATVHPYEEPLQVVTATAARTWLKNRKDA